MFSKQDKKKKEIIKISRYIYLQDDTCCILIYNQSIIISNTQKAFTSQEEKENIVEKQARDLNKNL